MVTMALELSEPEIRQAIQRVKEVMRYQECPVTVRSTWTGGENAM